MIYQAPPGGLRQVKGGSVATRVALPPNSWPPLHEGGGECLLDKRGLSLKRGGQMKPSREYNRNGVGSGWADKLLKRPVMEATR